MVHDIPSSYGSRTAPPIQEVAALGEGKVTGVPGYDRTTETHCGKAIIKSGPRIEDVLVIINRRWGVSFNVPK